MENKQETKKIEKVSPKIDAKEFVSLGQLLVDNPQVVNTWPKIDIKLSRSLKNGMERVFVQAVLHKTYLKGLTLRNFNKYITPTDFLNIVLSMGLKYEDDRGYMIPEWIKKAPARFITGKSSGDNTYKAVQVVLSKTKYIIHLFSKEEVEALDNLERIGALKIDWVETPEKIEDVDLEIQLT